MSRLARLDVATIGLLACLALVGLVEVPRATADSTLDTSSIPDPSRYEDLRERGRNAYNAEQYDKAERYYVEAIQAAPSEAQAYLDLARTFFWRKSYAAAVAHYDFYIQRSKGGELSEKVKSERRLAASRSGDDVWRVSEAQKRILDSLRTRLNEGRAYTEGGGGAWGLYRALLRTDYAHPDLIQIRNRLRTKLLEEFETRLTPASDEPTPQLSMKGWNRQIERLEAARKLTRNDELRSDIGGRMDVARVALDLLNGRYRKAAEKAGRAVEAQPDRLVLKWFHASALVQANRDDEAERVLERYAPDFRAQSHGADYLEILRATLAHRRGQLKEATRSYYELLER